MSFTGQTHISVHMAEIWRHYRPSHCCIKRFATILTSLSFPCTQQVEWVSTPTQGTVVHCNRQVTLGGHTFRIANVYCAQVRNQCGFQKVHSNSAQAVFSSCSNSPCMNVGAWSTRARFPNQSQPTVARLLHDPKAPAPSLVRHFLIPLRSWGSIGKLWRPDLPAAWLSMHEYHSWRVGDTKWYTDSRLHNIFVAIQKSVLYVHASVRNWTLSAFPKQISKSYRHCKYEERQSLSTQNTSSQNCM